MYNVHTFPTCVNPFLATASDFLKRGWPVIPIRKGSKAAAVAWKCYQQSKPSERTLSKWFAGDSAHEGLAVLTGRGLAVRDFDTMDGYHRWESDHPELAQSLPQVATPRGRHVYARIEEEQFVNFDDGELRADRSHYVLAPPSTHPDGPEYRWIIPLPSGELPLVSPKKLGGLPLTHQPTQLIACVTSVFPEGVGEAISLTLPTGIRQRNHCIWQLVRRLKAVVPDATPEMLMAILEEWFRHAVTVVRTKDFEVSKGDFKTAWVNCEVPYGDQAFLASVAAVVESKPYPSQSVKYENPHHQRLLAVCMEMQRRAGDETFFLAYRDAAELLGLDREGGKMTAKRSFDELRWHRDVERVKKGSYRGKAAKSDATEWRCRVKDES